MYFAMYNTNNKRTTSGSRSGLVHLRQVALASCLLVAILVASLASAAVDDDRLRVENRKVKESGNKLDEAINYLEGVDKYYSQLSRPRFGRSEYKQTASSLADRVAGYRLATMEVPAQPAPRWLANSVDYYPAAGQQQGHYPTVSVGDLLRRRLAAEQQQQTNYDQFANY